MTWFQQAISSALCKGALDIEDHLAFPTDYRLDPNNPTQVIATHETFDIKVLKELKPSVRLNRADPLYTQELLKICLRGRCSPYDVKMVAKAALSGPQHLQFFASYTELCQEQACINLASGHNLTFKMLTGTGQEPN